MFMRRLFQWLAYILVAFWLPATGHCSLEMAGILQGKAAQPCSCHGQGSCNDGCSTVEDGNYRPTTEVVKAPSPSLLFSVFLFSTHFVVLPVDEVVTSLDGAFDRASDWVPDWQFVRRTAPPARAPSSALI